jgi:hypothetical protein
VHSTSEMGELPGVWQELDIYNKTFRPADALQTRGSLPSGAFV